MNKIFSNAILRSRYFFALLAGLMLAVSFPKISVAGFAWIAPGLILFCGAGKTSRQQFWIGYVAGVGHFLTSLYWLLFIPFPAGAIAGWLALSTYLSLYTATWVWLCWKIFFNFISPAENATNPEVATSFAKKFSKTTWKQRAIWSLCCAVIWVALEMTMARLFSGFPWNFLGITQYKIVPLIQIASFTGVYGVSFLLVWFAVSLSCAGMLLVRKPQPARAWSAEILLPALAAAVIFSIGLSRIEPENLSRPAIKVALVQPSIPQLLIFDPNQNETRFQKIMELSERALAEKPEVLIWPEASIPPLTEANYQAITDMIRKHKVWMIFGADDFGIQETPTGNWETNYYNSAFLFSPNGELEATYRKRRLVIFGEYVPLEKWLPFMKWLTPIEGGFTPGVGPVPFKMDSLHAEASPLICFEDAFPHYAREHVATDTDFLLNLTNDGWFGKSAAQWQQAANAIFRAVENGVPMVRCTNNGLTCWADRFGRLRKYFGSESGDVYAAGFLSAEIPLRSAEEKQTRTVYNRYGDWFGWSCVMTAIGFLLLSLRKTSAKT